MNRGDLGARNLNQLLQAKLNPPQDGKPQVERFGYPIFHMMSPGDIPGPYSNIIQLSPVRLPTCAMRGL